jgi:hypothetical protein
MPGFCEENRLRLAVYVPYSLDIAPSDFFLFGHTKPCLQGIAFLSRGELLAVVHEIVGPSRDRPWKTWFGAGWRDSNGFLTMTTIIDKLNTG